MTDDARLFAPAAARNVSFIVEAMQARAPRSGTALEIAAGSGEHAVAIAAALPDLTWRPTDIDPARLASIDAWAAHAGAANVRKAAYFDAAAGDWAGDAVDLTFAANILHLIPDAAARSVVAAKARALKPGGRFMLYGPFLRETGFASEGDRDFDARLRREGDGGYKLVTAVETWMREAGLAEITRMAMPANNLILTGVKPE